MLALGLDIGYSAVKAAWGDPESLTPATLALPSIAGPRSNASLSLTGTTFDKGAEVWIDGEPWLAGIEFHEINAAARELHHDYPSTKQYRALALAAIDAPGVTEIDSLVTGLPVVHYQDEAKRAYLETLLSGQHVIRPGRVVNVKKVTVIPQPAGTFMDMASRPAHEGLLNNATVLVVDPGYFSVDWVIVREGVLSRHLSGSSMNAVSTILEHVDNGLRNDKKGHPGVDALERSLRHGGRTIHMYGAPVDLSPYLDRAAAELAKPVLTAINSMLRHHHSTIDVIIMTGGGSGMFLRHFAAEYPRSMVITSPAAHMSNAVGFWLYG